MFAKMRDYLDRLPTAYCRQQEQTISSPHRGVLRFGSLDPTPDKGMVVEPSSLEAWLLIVSMRVSSNSQDFHHHITVMRGLVDHVVVRACDLRLCEEIAKLFRIHHTKAAVIRIDFASIENLFRSAKFLDVQSDVRR